MKYYVLKNASNTNGWDMFPAGETINYSLSSETLSVPQDIELDSMVIGYRSAPKDKFYSIYKVKSKSQGTLVFEKELEVNGGASISEVREEVRELIESDYSGIFEIGREDFEHICESMFIRANADFVGNPGVGRSKLVHNTKEISNFYRSYITAIKSKPFLLLAGISGTGKSRIVRELARACWDVDCTEFKAQKPKNFEMVQVKPNWHDSSELIGFVSRIGADKDGNGVAFVAGDFLRFVAKAWENPEIPYFLCLDEMNLAPVEQYFAEYLSAIESRKAVNGGGRDYFKTDVVVKIGASETAWDDHGNSVLHNALEKLFAPYKDASGNLDTWASYVREVFTKDGGVSIPQNLVVMGTVNMDETTCSFSRKVLDRAMSFELNDVSDMYAPDKLVGEGDYEFGSIAAAAAKCSLLTGKEAYDANVAVGGKVLEYLKIVNEALEGKKFKIAYRSRNEIMIYCVERTNGGIVGLRQALDEATNLKILSRIEGDDQTFASFDLKDFRKTIVKGLLAIDNPSVQDSDVEDFLKDEVKVKASPCASKLGHMIDELSHGAGVVSYWE